MEGFFWDNKNKLRKRIQHTWQYYINLLRYQDSSIQSDIILTNLRKIPPFSIFSTILLLLFICSYFFGTESQQLHGYSTFAVIILLIIQFTFDFIVLKIDKGKNTNVRSANIVVNLFYYSLFVFLLGFNLLEIYYYHTFHTLFILCCVLSFCTITSLKKTVITGLITIVTSFIAFQGPLSMLVLPAMFIPIFFSFYVSLQLYLGHKKYFILSNKLSHKNNELESKLKTDHLTGIYNRYGLETHTEFLLPYAIHSKTPISIIMIDIDFFKSFNDTFGHMEGDKCLQRIAKALSASIKSDTDLVCRFGGEEFLIFCYNVAETETEKIALRVRNAVKALRIEAAEQKVSCHVTISIGVSNAVLTKKEDFYDLIKKADEELYKAKSKGRDCVYSHGRKVRRA